MHELARWDWESCLCLPILIIACLVLQGSPGTMGSPGRRGQLVSRAAWLSDFCPSSPLLGSLPLAMCLKSMSMGWGVGGGWP